VFVINEGEKLTRQLERMRECNADVVIADGGSSDGSTNADTLVHADVNTLLVKTGAGKLGAQMRMAFDWALNRGYAGVIVIDGNGKDSVENIPDFVRALNEGYAFVQGSRFIKGGRHKNTPLLRLLGLKLLHAPMISLAARYLYTDTTNGFRAYSSQFLRDEKTALFRDVFVGYELHYYLAIKAARLGYKVKEIPVSRVYPAKGNIPTKISPIKGNLSILYQLFKTVFDGYDEATRQKICNLFFFILSFICLYSAFYYNVFKTTNPHDFKFFQSDSEAAVIHSLVDDKMQGPGFFVIKGRTLWGSWDDDERQEFMRPIADYMAPLKITDDIFCNGVARYFACVVIDNNMINREFNKVGSHATFKDNSTRSITRTQTSDNKSNLYIYFDGEPIPPELGYPYLYKTDASVEFQKYNSQAGIMTYFFNVIRDICNIPAYFYNTFTASMLSLTLSLIALFVVKEFGYMLGSVFVISFIFSHWIVMMARNLYWQPWLFFLPMLCMTAHVSTRENKYVWLCFSALILKFANGYEFMTTVVISMLTPLIYISIKNGYDLMLLVKRFALWGVISIGAFVASLFIFFAAQKPFAHLIQRAVRRTISEQPEAGIMPGILYNIAKYTEGGPFWIIPISMRIFLTLTAFACVICFKLGGMKEKSLGVTVLFSLLAPLSWFILARQHSYIHTHINYVLWCVPFVPLACMAVFMSGKISYMKCKKYIRFLKHN
jgi:dolichol-phosphate mannosyltransferase